jgi:hypothetical protein
LEHLEVSEFLEKRKLASENSEKHKKNIKKFRKFRIIFLCKKYFFFFFSKNKNVPGHLPEASRLRELDYKQYELERFNGV